MESITGAQQRIADQQVNQASKELLQDPAPRMDRSPFLKRYNQMKDDGILWHAAWKDIQKYIVPTRGMFWATADDVPNTGRAIDHKVLLDGHATRSLNTLASGMTSGLTSPTCPWFRLGLQNQDLADFEPVKEWLAAVQERMMSVFSRSNIYGVLNSCYQEIGSFGTTAMMLVEDYHNVIRARSFTVGEYFLGTGPDGRVDRFARRYKIKASALIKEFGIENVSAKVANQFRQNSGDEWVSVLHVIEPNDERSPDILGYKGKAFRSVQWEESSAQNTFLRISGFDEFPVLAPRWETTTTADIYGRAPGWHALGDVKMLQKMQKDKLMALDKLINPPVQADGNVVDEVNLLPGGVTPSSSVSPNSGVRPVYQVQPDFAAIEKSIMVTKQGIDSFFYADLFMMIAQADRADMTAREIVERHEEKLLMLGPVLERLESELLDPLIDRTFSIMLRAGLIPPPPPEIQGSDLNIEYISMLAQAQKMVGVTAIDQVIAGVGNVVGVWPEAVDRIDIDEVIKHRAEMLGIPPKIVRSDEAVAQIRQAKQAAAAAQQKAAIAAQLAGGAKVLSDTKLGTNSALDMITGNQGAPA